MEPSHVHSSNKVTNYNDRIMKLLTREGLSSSEEESEPDLTKPVPKQVTENAPLPGKKVPCLFCSTAVTLNQNLVTSVKRREILMSFCTHMKFDVGSLPVDTSEEKFPFCKECLFILEGIWENEQVRQNATKSILKLVEKIETNVRDAEFLKKTTPQQCTSSTAIAEQQQASGLRELILEAYCNKIRKRRGIPEEGNAVPSSNLLNVPIGDQAESLNTTSRKINCATASGSDVPKQSQNQANVFAVNLGVVSLEEVEDEIEMNELVPPVPLPTMRAESGFSGLPPPNKNTRSKAAPRPKSKAKPQTAKSHDKRILRAHKEIPPTCTSKRTNVLPRRKSPESQKNNKAVTRGTNRVANYSQQVSNLAVQETKNKGRVSKIRVDSLKCAVCNRNLKKKCAYISHFKSHQNRRPIPFKKEVIEEDLEPPESPPDLFATSPIGVPSLISPLSRSEVTSVTSNASASGSSGIILREQGLVRFMRANDQKAYMVGMSTNNE